MVDNYTDNFNEHSDSLRVKREQDDFDNLQHTLSGVETGQQTRHGLRKDVIDPITGKKRSKSIEDHIRDTLNWLLANDPQYRLAHENLMNSLQEAQQVTQSALERVQAALVSERAILDKMLSSAAKLPDGTKVFKDKNGNVRTLNGEIVADDLAATIQWKGTEPSYEDITAQQQRVDALEEAENELRGIETELGDIHERGNTDTKPLTPEELQRDTGRADDLKERVQEVEKNIHTQAADISATRNDMHEDISIDNNQQNLAVEKPKL